MDCIGTHQFIKNVELPNGILISSGLNLLRLEILYIFLLQCVQLRFVKTVKILITGSLRLKLYHYN